MDDQIRQECTVTWLLIRRCLAGSPTYMVSVCSQLSRCGHNLNFIFVQSRGR